MNYAVTPKKQLVIDDTWVVETHNGRDGGRGFVASPIPAGANVKIIVGRSLAFIGDIGGIRIFYGYDIDTFDSLESIVA